MESDSVGSSQQPCPLIPLAGPNGCDIECMVKFKCEWECDGGPSSKCWCGYIPHLC